MSVTTSVARRRNWTSGVLVIASGLLLLALDVLPILLWAAVIAYMDRMTPGSLSPALVLGTFFVAIALSAFTAPRVHRWTRERAARKQ